MCYAQAETELKMMQLRVSRDQSEMNSMAMSAMDSHDVLEVAKRGVASLDAVKESRANIAEIERKLVAILDAKPFGLPLTAQEKKDLETAKKDIADAEESDTKDKAKADKSQGERVPSAVPSQVTRWATLRVEVPFTTPSGQVISLPIGTRLEFVSQEGSEIRIRYAGTEYLIPAEFAVIQ